MSIRSAVFICGLLLAALGLSWLYVFGFTDYRSHWRLWGLWLGFLTLVVGLHVLLWPFIRSFWRSE